MSEAEPALLTVSGLVVRYGAIAALRGVDLVGRAGEIVSVPCT